MKQGPFQVEIMPPSGRNITVSVYSIETSKNGNLTHVSLEILTQAGKIKSESRKKTTEIIETVDDKLTIFYLKSIRSTLHVLQNLKFLLRS